MSCVSKAMMEMQLRTKQLLKQVSNDAEDGPETVQVIVQDFGGAEDAGGDGNVEAQPPEVAQLAQAQLPDSPLALPKGPPCHYCLISSLTMDKNVPLTGSSVALRFA